MTNINRDLIVDALMELASESLQRRRWLEPSSPEISSFTEVVEELFTDSGLASALENNCADLPSAVESNLRRLHEMIRGVDRNQPPEVIIAVPEMSSIRAAAKEILDLMDD